MPKQWWRFWRSDATPTQVSQSSPSASASRPVDPLDGYRPEHIPRLDDGMRSALSSEIDRHRRARTDGADYSGVNLDGFVNELTGIGTVASDKMLGGQLGGPAFNVRFLSSWEAEDMARGSDLGGKIVDAIPDEMTRQGWTVQVQPNEDEAIEADGHLDDDPFGQPAPPPTPGALPKLNDDGIALAEQIEELAAKLDVLGAVSQALKYERCFGGAGILIGADDGEADLTKPLNVKAIKSIRHLTPYFGGWDGEIVAWRWYCDPREPKFGTPEVYMLRNLGVPLAQPPAPGERSPQPTRVPQGPGGAMIFYVHESRFLLFPGYPVSRRARVQMRGWGDSVFTRTIEVLSDYDQTWGGLSTLMSEFSIATLSVDGLPEMLASEDPARQGMLLKRAQMLNLSQSIARMRLIDKEEEFSRVTASIAGVPELMREMALRLAAAADMPLSLLMGQTQGGLGNAGNTDIRFFYDKIASRQRQRLQPLLTRLYRLMFLAADSPTQGVEPERWSVTPNPLWQETATEKAENRLKVAQSDQVYYQMGAVTPEEVAATRFGGADYSDGPIVLDIEGRAEMQRLKPAVKPSPGGKLLPGKPPPALPGAAIPAQAVPQPEPTAGPQMLGTGGDPITGDPVGQPSTVSGSPGAAKP